MTSVRACALATFLFSATLAGTSTSAGGAEATAGPELSSTAQVQPAVQRAVRWMATVPTEELRFDSALFLSQIRRVFDFPELETEFARARTVADRDDDHPHRILWVPDQTMPAEVTSGWTLPTTPDTRAKPNDVISEALHCGKNGFRPATLAYVCGPMRDDGGYYTTHALWAVILARDAGCIEGAEVTECIESMQLELIAAQPRQLEPKRSRDIDLFAERLLMLLLSGNDGEQVDGSARELLSVQRENGSFAVASADEPPYYAYHATGVSVWALSQWHARANR